MMPFISFYTCSAYCYQQEVPACKVRRCTQDAQAIKETTYYDTYTFAIFNDYRSDDTEANCEVFLAQTKIRCLT